LTLARRVVDEIWRVEFREARLINFA